MSCSAFRCTPDQYHGRLGYIHASNLLKFVESPATWRKVYVTWELPKPEATDAMTFGTIVHAMVLEPERVGDEFVCFPASLTGRGTVGVLTEWVEQNAGNREVIMPNVWREAQALADAIRNSPAGKPWLEAPGEVELSIDWQECGLNMTARLDKIFLREPVNLIWDLKTTAWLCGFETSFYKWGYDVQSAQYSAALKAWTGRDSDVYFGVVDKRNRECDLVPFPRDNLNIAIEKRRLILEAIRRCFDTGVWPERMDDPRVAPVSRDEFDGYADEIESEFLASL